MYSFIICLYQCNRSNSETAEKSALKAAAFKQATFSDIYEHSRWVTGPTAADYSTWAVRSSMYRFVFFHLLILLCFPHTKYVIIEPKLYNMTKNYI